MMLKLAECTVEMDVAFAAYCLGSVADAVTTWLAFRRGFEEANPTSVCNVLPTPLLLPFIEAPVMSVIFILISTVGKYAGSHYALACKWFLTLFRWAAPLHNVLVLLRG